MAKRPQVKVVSKCDVARSRADVAVRVTPTSRETAKPLSRAGTGRAGGKGAEIAYVTDTIQHGKIEAAQRGHSSWYSAGRACKTSDGEYRRGMVELAFLPRGKDAPAGPALRFCTKQGAFGPVVPVRSAAEAKRIAAKFTACTADSKKTIEACVVEAAGKKAAAVAGLSGVARRKARRSPRRV